jgi:hypothetical protein
VPYHSATFRLLGFEPPEASADEAVVQEVEKRLGLSLPLSVREWYTRKDAVKILADHSNGDPPIPVKEFALKQWQVHRLLPFRIENQGICTWAIDLNGSDDPPVYVDVDSDGTEWQRLASRFSDYVYTCVWDYRIVFWQPALVQAQNTSLSKSALDNLAAMFSEQVQTHGWPGSTQYRFVRGGQAILIWAVEGGADWFVAAPEAEALERTLLAVWHLDNVGKCLYACPNSKLGKEALEGAKARVNGQGGGAR